MEQDKSQKHIEGNEQKQEQTGRSCSSGKCCGPRCSPCLFIWGAFAAFIVVKFLILG